MGILEMANTLFGFPPDGVYCRMPLVRREAQSVGLGY
jgi:hypothetical protein